MSCGKVICISGIDTGIGKTIVTGLFARWLMSHGHDVITQKMCQTGCNDISEDIEIHRQMMGEPLKDYDREGVTCPYIFSEPCSPHLAAKLSDSVIDPGTIAKATARLALEFEYVLLEGAGGLMVPLTLDYTIIDYLVDHSIPLLLVSSSRLGSINHTLSALEIIRLKELKLLGIVYNAFADDNQRIVADSLEVFRHYLPKLGFADSIIEIGSARDYSISNLPDFSIVLDNLY